MKLYHLTNPQNAEGIIRDRRITTAAVRRERKDLSMTLAAPVMNAHDRKNESVVWLTNELAARQAWQVEDFKWCVRFEVETTAQKWAKFCEANDIPRWYRNRLEYRGTNADSWYVHEGDVGSTQWKRIEITERNETIWTPGESLDAAADEVAKLWAELVERIENGEFPHANVFRARV